MAFNVDEFRNAIQADGARPNLFDVEVTLKAGSSAQRKLTFSARAAQLPGSTIGYAPLSYFGREVKFAGNRTFEPWTITIINDEDFAVRNAIELWMQGLNQTALNIRTYPGQIYQSDAKVTQYSKQGLPIKSYSFKGLFPTELGAISLDWGTNDTIEEFDVTFQYQYWVESGSLGAIAGGIASAAGIGSALSSAASAVGL